MFIAAFQVRLPITTTHTHPQTLLTQYFFRPDTRLSFWYAIGFDINCIIINIQQTAVQQCSTARVNGSDPIESLDVPAMPLGRRAKMRRALLMPVIMPVMLDSEPITQQ